MFFSKLFFHPLQFLIDCLLLNNKEQSEGAQGGSVNKVLALKPRGPEFNP